MNIHNLKCGIRAGMKLLYSRITGKPLPVWSWNYITNKCNLKCLYCFQQPHPAADLTLSELIAIFDEQIELGVEMFTLLGGEPTLRKDLPAIVDYLWNKGKIVDLVTNGYFVKNVPDYVWDRISSVCVSMDGNRETTDALRGEGTYDKAIEAIEFLKKRGKTIRIHGVITKLSLNALPEMKELCDRFGVEATYAMPTIHQNEDVLRVSDGDIRFFWCQYNQFKRQGAPFFQTEAAVDCVINWPYPYYQTITEKDYPLKKDAVRCRQRENMMLVAGDGSLCACTDTYGDPKAPNANLLGVKVAYKRLLEQPNPCISCGQLSAINTSLMIGLDWRALREMVVSFFRMYMR